MESKELQREFKKDDEIVCYACGKNLIVKKDNKNLKHFCNECWKNYTDDLGV